MQTELSIFYKTNETFKVLDEKYEDNLKYRIFLIFALLGGLQSLIGYLINYAVSEFYASTLLGYIVEGLLLVLTGGLLIYLTGNYLLSHLTLGIGKLLKGQAKLIDIRIIISYATIPFFILLIYNTVYLIMRQTGFQFPNLMWLDFSVLAVVYFLSTRILFLGIRRFNAFGNIKTIINIIPFILVFCIFIAFRLLINLGVQLDL